MRRRHNSGRQQMTETDQTGGVETKSADYLTMEEAWEPVDALRNTFTMRAARTRWLPKQPKEKEPRYNFRIANSWLYPAYAETVHEVSAAPFRQPVKLSGEDSLPKSLRGADSNIDMKGRSLTQLGAQLLLESAHRGLCHVLPEYPVVPAGLTRAQEDALGARAYLTIVSPTQLYGFCEGRDPGGTMRVASFRVYSESTEKDPSAGRFAEKMVCRVRVYNLAYEDQEAERATPETELEGDEGGFLLDVPGTVETHVKGKDSEGNDEWRVESVTRYSFVGYPLHTHYTKRTGFLSGEPALGSLAEVNIAHWQTSSDQNNIVNFARVPILTRSGVDSKQIRNPTPIGAGSVHDSTNPSFRMAIVEHTGKAIGAGRQHGLDYIEQMETLRLKPRLRPGDIKATASNITEGRNQSDLEKWALEVADVLRAAYVSMAAFTGDEVGDEFSVTVDATNLALEPGTQPKLDFLLKARAANQISRQLFLTETRRLGGFDEAIDVDGEIEQQAKEALEEREAQGAALAGFTDFAPQNPSDPIDVSDEEGAGVA